MGGQSKLYCCWIFYFRRISTSQSKRWIQVPTRTKTCWNPLLMVYRVSEKNVFMKKVDHLSIHLTMENGSTLTLTRCDSLLRITKISRRMTRVSENQKERKAWTSRHWPILSFPIRTDYISKHFESYHDLIFRKEKRSNNRKSLNTRNFKN